MKNKKALSRRKFISSTTLATLGSLGATEMFTSSAGIKTKNEEGKFSLVPYPEPNLLYIVVDEMREIAISCSWDVNIQTPGLDQLASDGIRFTHIYSANPLSFPSRATIHTGLFPYNAGMPHNQFV